MASTNRKLPAIIASVVLAALLLCSACAQQPSGENEGGDMSRMVGEQTTGQVAIARVDEPGSYTVVIDETNVVTDQQFVVDTPLVVTPEEAIESDGGEEELTRAVTPEEAIESEEAIEPNEGADESPAVETSEEANESDEGAEKSEESPAVETSEEANESDEGADQNTTWSLGDVKQEDVTVFYYAPSSDDGEAIVGEVRQAEVTAFANNGDSIELSFVDPSGDDSTVDTYTVHFANSDNIAVVVIAEESNDFEMAAIDYDAKVSEELENVDIGFTAEDVALPEGTYIEDGQLIVTDEAPEVVQDVLVDSGIAEGELSRDNPTDDSDKGEGQDSGNGGSGDAATEYMKEVNERQKKYKNYDAVADYSVEVLDYVDPTAGKAAEFGADAYYVFRGVYTGDVGSVLKGGLGVLKMFGLFKKKGPSPTPGVTNEQILSEVQKVGIEVVDVHNLVAAMNDTVNITRQELYSQGVEAYDNALLALEGDAEILQNMLTQGASAAALDGIEPLDEDCTAEEEFEYNFQLINYIKEQEQKNDRKSQKFAGFTRYAEDLGNNFTLVAGATAKPPNTNPIIKYDKYWNTYFNYETQGYYLRQAYRSNIEYQLKRAFFILEIYHNIFDPEAGGVKLSYNNQFCGALESLEEMTAGQSPEEINVYKPFRVYCPTFDGDVTQISVQRFAWGNNVVYESLLEYANRLHGRTLQEDLELAGLWGDGRDPGSRDQRLLWYNPPWEELGPNDDVRRRNRQDNYCYGGHGIGFNCKDKDYGHYVADIVGIDGGVYKEQPTFNFNMWECFQPYDLPKEGGPYSVNEMRYIFLGLTSHAE